MFPCDLESQSCMKQFQLSSYPEKECKRFPIEPDSEVLWVEPEAFLRGRNDLLEEAGLLPEDAAQLLVVEDLLLVEVGQLLAEGNGVLPLLVPLEVVDDLQVELLLSLPLFLTRISVEREGKRE